MVTKNTNTHSAVPDVSSAQLAVVLVRGFAKIPYFIEETFDRLHLQNRRLHHLGRSFTGNRCSVGRQTWHR